MRSMAIRFPVSAGLALVLGLSRETLRLWSKDEDKKEFFGILERINQKQECVLLDNGLNGTFNSNITKLVLGKHGYHDRNHARHRDCGIDGDQVRYGAHHQAGMPAREAAKHL